MKLVIEPATFILKMFYRNFSITRVWKFKERWKKSNIVGCRGRHFGFEPLVFVVTFRSHHVDSRLNAKTSGDFSYERLFKVTDKSLMRWLTAPLAPTALCFLDPRRQSITATVCLEVSVKAFRCEPLRHGDPGRRPSLSDARLSESSCNIYKLCGRQTCDLHCSAVSPPLLAVKKKSAEVR